jgi:molybdopterin synthase catalytic subunit
MKAWITRDPIVAETVMQHVGGSSDGAINLFLGVVRDHNEGRAVSGMHYDVYLEMAEHALRVIVAEAEAQCDGGQVAAVHRVGELKIGEISVAIAASAPHRAEAFAACRYVIEEIKKRLPVWKHERYVTGESEWLRGEQASTRTREHGKHAG